MNNLKLRTKLFAIAVPPLVVLAVLVAYAMKVAFLEGPLDAEEVQHDLRTFGIIGFAGLIASALVLVLVTRSLTGPLARLTRTADELANTRLPALVEMLRNPNQPVPAPVDSAPVDADDELGRLATALDTVHAVATEVTIAQRGIVRDSVSTLVVNLARRNQALLDRQLELIDQLETTEQDPDRLEELYRLDHLATRMRRNAESLLVLAGAEPPRRRGAPVELVDVVRVAMGEIEDYRHVELGGIQDARLPAAAAVDLSHLLSELMENATQFSPPDVPVVVEGGRTGDGSYAIAVVDRGIGMNDQQRSDANAVLVDPPQLGLALSRSLGFLVIGRLGKRLGVGITLLPTPGGGTTATVELPANLILDAPSPVQVAASVQPRMVQPAASDHRLADLPPRLAAVEPAVASAPGPFAAELAIANPWTAQPEASAASDHEVAASPAMMPPEADEEPEALDDERDSIGDDDGVPPLPWFRHQQAISADPTRSATSVPAAVHHDPLEQPEAPAPSLPINPEHPSVAGVDRRGGPHLTPVPASETRAPGFDEPRRLAEALPEGDAFEQGVIGLLDPPAAPTSDHLAVERTDAGLTRRRRGEHAPVEQGTRPVAASGRSPEEIREMLARYRQGIKHRQPEPGRGPEPQNAPSQEDLR